MISHNPDKTLRIGLDSKDIVFRRTHRDGQKKVIKGHVTFFSQTPTTIKSVKVILKGVRKVSWFTNTLQPQTVQQKETIHHQEQKLHVFVRSAAQASKAEPGLYTWPFTFSLSGDLPESVSWLPYNTSISYTLTAEVATGILSMVTSTTEDLQLIKSPSFWADDLYFAPEFRELTFPSDLTCQIFLAQPYQPTDGELSLDFTITGNRNTSSDVESIKLDLLQTVQLAVTRDHKLWRSSKEERLIKTITRTPNDIVTFLESPLPESNCATIRFSVPMQLPLVPFTCVQSVNEENVNVRYKLRVTVCTQDEDGKASNVRRQSVYLFPKLFSPIQKRPRTILIPSNSSSSSSSSDASSEGTVTPPELPPELYDGSCACDSLPLPPYGEHVFDKPYHGEVRLPDDDIWNS
ncbi:uncharacterized protein K452DRAFT_147987 [Aplosporella prunicola CBS 121167]|uniref:Uncharacterized protein n=1 Tax=Aplosporella prunicola CBS 121167 TaxID=1176127 RepID=A0A6A6BQH2_9PEZI|nr:uncharacterized protein K452DRAFT_147987 [Aplosporella prunicola CBS 121167]KAF2144831.1 hypothetical protein K452DRAFT_147987 [Aplosporella prunicola CBS 121167]